MTTTPRVDLMALTPDDLAALTNRGTVKRAQREIESNELTGEISEETGGDLVVTWSDGTVCRFPAQGTVHDAICSSGLPGISRHIVRSILAYQQLAASSGTQAKTETFEHTESVDEAYADSMSSSGSLAQPLHEAHRVWDPGSISDEALINLFRKPAIVQARKRFEQGVLVELTRGTKPLAHFLDVGLTVRFPVPGDVRYATADCAESMLATWVAAAVWAFRELPSDRLAGLLCLQQADLPVPHASLDQLQAMLGELTSAGMANVSATWAQRLGRVELALRDEGLVWPAELVLDLLHQFEAYQQHDARFEPQQVVQIVGEITARTRAVKNATRAVPQPLIRGTRADRATDIAGGRFTGVGLGVRLSKRHTTIAAYLLDVDTGTVSTVERTYADPDPKSGDAPRSFAELANGHIARGVSLANLGLSQIILKSGKRTPSGQLSLPRTSGSVTIYPQAFQWEQLKSPFAAEDFAQLAARLEMLPPSYLRPRRRTENLHVVAIRLVDEVQFDVAQQRLTARLHDSQGGIAKLVQPFHSRGREAFNDLAAVLDQRANQVRYGCGHVRFVGRELELRPISLVVEDGTRRIGMSPWLPSERPSGESCNSLDGATNSELNVTSVVAEFVERLNDMLADALLIGLRQCPVAPWGEFANAAEQIGFVRLAEPIGRLAELLNSRANSLSWDDQPASRALTDLCLLARIANE